MKAKLCEINGCSGPHSARGYCKSHYNRYLMHKKNHIRKLRFYRWIKNEMSEV